MKKLIFWLFLSMELNVVLCAVGWMLWSSVDIWTILGIAGSAMWVLSLPLIICAYLK